MAQDPAKPLDIDAIEAALDELLEHYRQALRAVELLPRWGHMLTREYLHADWIRRHLTVRPLVSIFLRSHIRAKLHTVADNLEVERFASGHMDANTSKRLDDIIKKLRAYDKFLIQRRTFWLGLPGWLWVVVAPVLTTLILGIPNITVTVGELLGDIIIYSFFVVLFFWPPLYFFGALAGFHWKRLILMGQTRYISINVATNIVSPPVLMPQANTYEFENRLFKTIGLPKPDEFPWDLVLAPLTIMLAALALAFFLLAIAFLFANAEPSWPALIAVALLVASFGCIDSVRRLIDRDMRERRQHSAC